MIITYLLIKSFYVFSALSKQYFTFSSTKKLKSSTHSSQVLEYILDEIRTIFGLADFVSLPLINGAKMMTLILHSSTISSQFHV